MSSGTTFISALRWRCTAAVLSAFNMLSTAARSILFHDLAGAKLLKIGQKETHVRDTFPVCYAALSLRGRI